MMNEIVRTTIDAYIRFLPRYYGEMIFTGMTSAPVPTDHPRAPINQFGYRRSLADHNFMFVVRVNNDTMYNGGWVDLSSEPFILGIPNTEGRFWSIQLTDRWTEVMPGISSRSGSPPGSYALVGPKWKGDLPSGVHRVNCPENIMFVICRIGYQSFEDPGQSAADLELASQVLRRFTGLPLSEYTTTGVQVEAPPSKNTPPPPVSPRALTAELAANQPLALLTRIRDTVSKPDCPLSAAEKKLLTQFSQHLDAALKESTSSKSDQPTVTAMFQGLELARRLIDTRVRAAKPNDNGWVTIHAGKWENRWLDRAAISEYAIWANRPEASVYPEIHSDLMGLSLNGKYKYTLHFAADQLPPVDDFWSITLYRGDTFTLVENPIKRYSIGDRTPGLAYSEDGSLTIYIQKERPEGLKAANWLPCGENDFNLMIRLYGPSKTILDGSYKLPPVLRTDEAAFLKGEGIM